MLQLTLGFIALGAANVYAAGGPLAPDWLLYFNERKMLSQATVLAVALLTD